MVLLLLSADHKTIDAMFLGLSEENHGSGKGFYALLSAAEITVI